MTKEQIQAAHLLSTCSLSERMSIQSVLNFKSMISPHNSSSNQSSTSPTLHSKNFYSSNSYTSMIKSGLSGCKVGSPPKGNLGSKFTNSSTNFQSAPSTSNNTNGSTTSKHQRRSNQSGDLTQVTDHHRKYLRISSTLGSLPSTIGIVF